MARVVVALLSLAMVVSAPGAARAARTACDGRWSVFPDPSPNGTQLYDVAAVSANDVWAVGYRWRGDAYGPIAEHWDGTTWSFMDLPRLEDDAYLFGVAAVAADDVWAVGSSALPLAHTLIEHWDGSRWSIVPSPSPSPFRNQLFDAVAISSDDVWAVGDGAHEGGDVSLILHWDGHGWTSVRPPNLGKGIDHLESVDGVAANDVWAVGQWTTGEDGVVQSLTLHWDGSSWTQVEAVPHQPNPNYLTAVSAIAADTVLAVGGSNWGTATLAIRWDGERWIRDATDRLRHTSHFLKDVSADPAGDAWMVGYYLDDWQRTEVQQWNGTAWYQVRSPNSGAISWLEGVITVSLDEAWAVGVDTDGALIEHYCTGGTA